MGGMCWEDKDSKSINEALKNGDIWLSTEIETAYKKIPPKKYVERKKGDKKNTRFNSR